MAETTYTVLFICQQNAARSLMAEAMLNKHGNGRFEAFSAGFEPADVANPTVMQLLKEEGFATKYLRPKHYSVFLEDDAPHMDFVFTLCEDSEQEAKVSIWNELSNDTITAHWHFADPAQLELDNESEREKMIRVQLELSQRINIFMSLPDHKLVKLVGTDTLGSP